MSDDDETSLPANRYREDDWDSHVAGILMQALQKHGVSYEWLAIQVTLRNGTPITANKLKEQLSKGDISARLLLQIIDSLSDRRLSLKDFYPMESTKRKDKE